MTARSYVPRTAEATLRDRIATNPVAAVTGPRQSGKTTLVRTVCPNLPYENLESPDIREFAIQDPRGFLAPLLSGGIIDEVQRVPDLLSYIQVAVDDGAGPLVLTGSAQLTLHERVSQSLAGRVAYVHLLPFSRGELQQAERAPRSLEESLFRGSYPPVYDRDADPVTWYADYVASYVERDVRQLVRIMDLDAFQRFLRLCAGWTGQILNLERMARDCGISANTAKSWLGVLRASYVVHLLQPHHTNFRKRVVRSPKLHFVDTGLAARLLGIQGADQLESHPLRGALFESWVASELLKGRLHRGLPAEMYFWQSYSGVDIDVLIDLGTELVPVECKSGATVTADAFRNLQEWCALASGTPVRPHLVYGGQPSRTQRDVRVLGFRDIGELADIEPARH